MMLLNLLLADIAGYLIHSLQLKQVVMFTYQIKDIQTQVLHTNFRYKKAASQNAASQVVSHTLIHFFVHAFMQ